jgi:hypothetical protein
MTLVIWILPTGVEASKVSKLDVVDIDAGAKEAKVDEEVSPVMHIGTRRPWPEFGELLQVLEGALFVK